LSDELVRLKSTVAVDKAVLQQGEETLQTLIAGMRKEGREYRGVLEPRIWTQIDRA
jgi:phosphoribosylamine-glycine ligase